MTGTEERIAGVLTGRFRVAPALVRADASFEALSFDSLALIELSLALEKEFGVGLDAGELADEATITAAAALVDARLAER